MTRKFFLDQHGCAKNQVDGELIISRLLALGFEQTDDSSEADLIVVNSCGFIESAKQESLGAVMQARSSSNAKILLTGCLAERYAEVFKTELPEADGILGNGDLTKLDDAVNALFSNQRPVIKAEQKGVCCGDRAKLLSFPGSAYVKITEGCNNCCTFCAIPLIRGHLRSRNADEIVQEIKLLVETRGIYEINLIGQDLAAFGTGGDDDAGCDLAGLIEKISCLKGDFVVRLLYIHPDHFNENILEAMKKDSRFLPYFDIPFQSGSDRIITTMNRTGPSSKYTGLVKKIRSVFPEAAIRTTFLTGFPGETEEDAEATKQFLKTIQSDWSGCFSYSREDDTPAYSFKNRVPHKTAEKRAAELVEIQSGITLERLRQRVGKTYNVLVEEIVENKQGTDEGLAIGRAWFQAPEVDGNVVIRYDLDDKAAVENIKPGKVVKVKAEASSEFDLDGVFCAG